MSTLSYKQLASLIDGMTDEQKQMTVTLYNTQIDEYHPLILMHAHSEDSEDRLGQDPGVLHPVLQHDYRSKFSDVRACKLWIEYDDGSKITTDDFLDMDESVEEHIRLVFEDPDNVGNKKIVNFKWRELRYGE